MRSIAWVRSREAVHRQLVGASAQPATPLGVEILNSVNQWVEIDTTDMSHRKDAVKAWNEGLYKTGPKSSEVRQFMTDPRNYELDSNAINRSKGAKLGEVYRPPEKKQ